MIQVNLIALHVIISAYNANRMMIIVFNAKVLIELNFLTVFVKKIIMMRDI